MTPTLTTVLIRPFLICFCKRAAADVLRTTSIPLNSAPSTSVTATDRLETMNPRGLSDADNQVGAWDFFSGQIFCSKQELSALLPNPLLLSAQHTHHSVLDALSAGLVVPLDVVHEVVGAFEVPLAQLTAVRLLCSEFNQVAVFLRLQLLQSLALVFDAGEGDIERCLRCLRCLPYLM